MHHGESPWVLTTVSEDDSRAKWLCHRYVEYETEIGGVSRRTIFKTGFREPPPNSGLEEGTNADGIAQIGFGSNKKTRHMMPSGHKAFLVHNIRDVDLLLMHNKTFAAECVPSACNSPEIINRWNMVLIPNRISHAVSSRKRIEIVARAKELGVKVTNPKARVTTEV